MNQNFDTPFFLFQSPHISDRFEHHLAFNDVQAFAQGRIVFTCFAPALVSQLQSVFQRSVGQCHGRRVWHCTGDVCHAVMHDAVYGIDRFGMCRRMGSLEAAALVDRHIDQYRSGLHQTEHVACNQMGSLVTGDQY